MAPVQIEMSSLGYDSFHKVEQGPARLSRTPWASRVLDLGAPDRKLPTADPTGPQPHTTSLLREPGPSGWTGLFWVAAPDPHGNRDEYTLLTDPDGVSTALVLRGVCFVDHPHPANGIVGHLRPRTPFTERCVPGEVWARLQALHGALLDAEAWLDHPAWAAPTAGARDAATEAQARTLLNWAPFGYTVDQARGWEADGVHSAASLRTWLSTFDGDATGVTRWAPHFTSADQARPWVALFDDPALARAWHRFTLKADTAHALHVLGWHPQPHGTALALARRRSVTAPAEVVPFARVAARHGLEPADALTLLSAGLSVTEADTALADGTLDLDGLRALTGLRH